MFSCLLLRFYYTQFVRPVIFWVFQLLIFSGGGTEGSAPPEIAFAPLKFLIIAPHIICLFTLPKVQITSPGEGMGVRVRVGEGVGEGESTKLSPHIHPIFILTHIHPLSVFFLCAFSVNPYQTKPLVKLFSKQSSYITRWILYYFFVVF
jgi:hypothetical protein